MRLWLGLALLLVVPAGEACSLIHRPFDQAQWQGELAFNDGGSLRRVEGAVERVVADGWFLTYAQTSDGYLVAGQEGLGADCSGDSWLRLYRDGAVAWTRAAKATVFPHEEGAVVFMADKAYRLREGRLVDAPLGVPRDAWIFGITNEGQPVSHDGLVLRVGDYAFRTPSADFAVAHSPSETAVVRFLDGQLLLSKTAGDGVLTNLAWTVGQDLVDVAWADAWIVAAGGRAFRVVGDQVTDLGLRDVVAVGERSGQAVVFQSDGYTVFIGTIPVEASSRGPAGLWSAKAPRAEPSQVTGVTQSSTRGTHFPVEGGPSDGEGRGTPFPSALLLALALLAAAAVRRR
jgi:MYXO-CTERM domain-containing protein